MLKKLIASRISAFEKQYDYDMAYAREVLSLGASVYKRFYDASLLTGYHEGLSVDAWFGAQLVGIMAGDCGPCVQLTVKMAEEAGVNPVALGHVISGSWEQLPDDMGLIVRFTHALSSRSPALSELREDVRERFGTEALVSVAYALISTHMYPTLKYALGHGESCSRVHVGGTVVSKEAPSLGAA